MPRGGGAGSEGGEDWRDRDERDEQVCNEEAVGRPRTGSFHYCLSSTSATRLPRSRRLATRTSSDRPDAPAAALHTVHQLRPLRTRARLPLLSSPLLTSSSWSLFFEPASGLYPPFFCSVLALLSSYLYLSLPLVFSSARTPGSPVSPGASRRVCIFCPSSPSRASDRSVLLRPVLFFVSFRDARADSVPLSLLPTIPSRSLREPSLFCCCCCCAPAPRVALPYTHRHSRIT